MTVTHVALLAGLFAVPALLLLVGHRLRKRSRRTQYAFWGAVVAHLMAAVVAVMFSMIPPEGWESTDFWRGAFTVWALLLLPVAGATVGAMRGAYRTASRTLD